MIYVIGLGIIVLATIAIGIFYYFQPSIVEGSYKLKLILGSNSLFFILILIAATVSIFSQASFSETLNTQVDAQTTSSSGLGYIAAALSTGLATIGAGYAVGSVGSSALGAVSENPKILGKTLIFVGLAEGIAIYGLIISILILGKL